MASARNTSPVAASFGLQATRGAVVVSPRLEGDSARRLPHDREDIARDHVVELRQSQWLLKDGFSTESVVKRCALGSEKYACISTIGLVCNPCGETFQLSEGWSSSMPRWSCSRWRSTHRLARVFNASSTARSSGACSRRRDR